MVAPESGLEAPPATVRAAAAVSEEVRAQPPTAAPAPAKMKPKRRSKTEARSASPSRRVKHHVPESAKIWFLVWARHMVAKYDYTMLDCWWLVQKWAPSVFGPVRLSTFQHKSLTKLQRNKVAASGRPKNVPDPVLQRLCVQIHDLVKHGVPFG